MYPAKGETTENNNDQYLSMDFTKQQSNPSPDYLPMSSNNNPQYYFNANQQQQQPNLSQANPTYYLSLQNDYSRSPNDYLQPVVGQQSGNVSQQPLGTPVVSANNHPVGIHEPIKQPATVTTPNLHHPQQQQMSYPSYNSSNPGPFVATPSYPQSSYPSGSTPNSVFLHPVPGAPRPDKRKLYPKKHSLVLGMIQVACGLFSIIFNIVTITLNAPIAPVSHGIWCGIFSILAGSFGIAAGRHRIVCLIITHLVLSIINAVVVWGQIFTSIAGVSLDSSVCLDPSTFSYGIYSSFCSDYTYSVHSPALALDSLLLIIGLIQFVVALWAASMTCRFYCCSCCQSCCCTCYDNQLNGTTHQQFQVSVSAAGYPGVQQTSVVHPYNGGNRESGYQHLVPDQQPPPYESTVRNSEEEYSYIM